MIPEDSTTFLIRFAAPSPEELYDATYHVRVLPSHLWATKPKGSWAADTSVANLVGSGPYRITAWRHGQFVTLEADPVRRSLRPFNE